MPPSVHRTHQTQNPPTGLPKKQAPSTRLYKHHKHVNNLTKPSPPTALPPNINQSTQLTHTANPPYRTNKTTTPNEITNPHQQQPIQNHPEKQTTNATLNTYQTNKHFKTPNTHVIPLTRKLLNTN